MEDFTKFTSKAEIEHALEITRQIRNIDHPQREEYVNGIVGYNASLSAGLMGIDSLSTSFTFRAIVSTMTELPSQLNNLPLNKDLAYILQGHDVDLPPYMTNKDVHRILLEINRGICFELQAAKDNRCGKPIFLPDTVLDGYIAYLKEKLESTNSCHINEETIMGMATIGHRAIIGKKMTGMLNSYFEKNGMVRTHAINSLASRLGEALRIFEIDVENGA